MYMHLSVISIFYLFSQDAASSGQGPPPHQGQQQPGQPTQTIQDAISFVSTVCWKKVRLLTSDVQWTAVVSVAIKFVGLRHDVGRQ